MNDKDHKSAVSRITGLASQLRRKAEGLDAAAVLDDARRRAADASAIIAQELRLAREDIGRGVRAVRDYQSASTDDLAELKQALMKRSNRAPDSDDQG